MKTNVYLSDSEWSLVTISFISMAIAFAIGLPLYFGGYSLASKGYLTLGKCMQIGTLSLFCISLCLLFASLVSLVYGEIKLHAKGLNKKQVKQVVTYCYPEMNNKQFKTYYKILCKSLKENKKSFKTMGFADFKDADCWAQTKEYLTLERKWTAQLSEQYNMHIKY